jgi:hypothetical protein
LDQPESVPLHQDLGKVIKPLYVCMKIFLPSDLFDKNLPKGGTSRPFGTQLKLSSKPKMYGLHIFGDLCVGKEDDLRPYKSSSKKLGY